MLNADECEESGFNVIPLPQSIREQLREKAPVIWDWVGNPVDMSIMRDTGTSNVEILTMMAKHPDFDFLIGQITEDDSVRQEDFTLPRSWRNMKPILKYLKTILKPIVVVLGDSSLGNEEMGNWRWQLFGQVRTGLVKDKLPFFPTIGRATRVLKELIDYYQRKTVS